MKTFLNAALIAGMLSLPLSIPAHAGIYLNSVQVNGFPANGIMVNGIMVNGVQVNGAEQKGLVQADSKVVSGLSLKQVKVMLPK